MICGMGMIYASWLPELPPHRVSVDFNHIKSGETVHTLARHVEGLSLGQGDQVLLTEGPETCRGIYLGRDTFFAHFKVNLATFNMDRL